MQAAPGDAGSWLDGAAARLLAERGYEATLRAIAELAVERLADFCVVDILEDGALSRVALTHRDPAMRELVQDYARRFPPGAEQRAALARLTDTRAFAIDFGPEQIATSPWPEEKRAVLRAVDIRSVATAPLRAAGTIVGVLHLVRTGASPRFTPDDLALAEGLAARASLAVKRELLMRAQETSRLRAESIAKLATALSAAAGLDDVARAMVEHAPGAVGASNGVLAVTEDDGAALRVFASFGLASDRLEPWRRFPVDERTPMGRALQLGRTLYLSTRDDLAREYPGLPVPPRGAWAVAPIVARGRALGAISFGFPDASEFTASERANVESVVQVCAQALDRALLHAELQRDVETRRRAEQRAHALRSVAEGLAGALTVEDVARIAVERGLRAVGAAGGSVAVLDLDGATIRVVADYGYPADVMAQYRRFPRDAGYPLAEAIREGRSIVLRPSTTPSGYDPGYVLTRAALGTRASAAIPVTVGGAPAAALGVTYPEGRDFSEDELRFLETLAAQSGQALARARVAEELARQRDHYEALVRAQGDAGNGIAVVGPRGLVWINDAYAALAGRSREEMLAPGFDPMSVVHPDERAGILRRGRLRAAGEKVDDRYETRFVRPDGEIVHVEVFVAHLKDPTLRMSIVRDVTERKRQARELEEARLELVRSERMSAMGSLVAGVAHEIRTPLAYIANNVHLIEQRLDRVARRGGSASEVLDDLRGHVAEAASGVDRISRLVGELRRFTRVPTAERRATTLDAVARDAAGLFLGATPAARRLAVDLAPTPAVDASAPHLQQVVLNLLQNAAEATEPTQSAIRLVTRPSPDGRSALLTVEDDGPGIPEDVQARMFEPLYTTKPEGTGLGLAIARRILEDHGGGIRVESAPGKGARFVVSLPARDATTASPERG